MMKRKIILVLFVFTFAFIFSSCDKTSYRRMEFRIAEYTGHETLCNCSECWTVGEALNMLDMLKDDELYCGVDSISIEKNGDMELSSEWFSDMFGGKVENVYYLTVHYTDEKPEEIPSVSDIWYLTKEDDDAKSNHMQLHKTADGKTMGYSVRINDSYDFDLSDSVYVLY